MTARWDLRPDQATVSVLIRHLDLCGFPDAAGELQRTFSKERSGVTWSERWATPETAQAVTDLHDWYEVAHLPVFTLEQGVAS